MGVTVHHLKPCANIVLTSQHKMTHEQAEAAKRTIEERFPGHPVTVLRGFEMIVMENQA